MPDDQEFLYQLYASTRLHEIAGFGWPAAQQEMFLRMQFNAQYRSYEAAYGQAEHQIVEQDGAARGPHHGAVGERFRAAGGYCVADGTSWPGDWRRPASDLIQKCARKKVPLRLQVLKTNPALRLYQRLGFATTGEDQMYIQMERRPG